LLNNLHNYHSRLRPACTEQTFFAAFRFRFNAGTGSKIYKLTIADVFENFFAVNVVINILNRWNTMRNGFDTLEDAKNYIKHLLHAEASAKAELLHGGL